jgi:hypothetical protein
MKSLDRVRGCVYTVGRDGETTPETRDTAMEYAAWLQSLKVGDLVGVGMGYGNQYRVVLRKVGRASKTQIVIADGTYRRSDGGARGSVNWDKLIQPTAEMLANYEARSKAI